MKNNTPTLTRYEESIAPWNDRWCYPLLLGRGGYDNDEDCDDEEDEYIDEWHE